MNSISVLIPANSTVKIHGFSLKLGEAVRVVVAEAEWELIKQMEADTKKPYLADNNKVLPNWRDPTMEELNEIAPLVDSPETHALNRAATMIMVACFSMVVGAVVALVACAVVWSTR